ncbi:GerAB/ArcD/ProY family transporter [Paenibacillus anseongense]|uniref:GerAB/ArcD/ProY family transporter n=1 Tax=Paenibacillus anseongense TaxID=2682845 RepID=UPI002DC05682|nr:GerAB/ArcD/ProY family transporter [Paenibacillus anseongense]MEC0264534.1 GerAB/ArcD/ProY family transporter [Paenibacillus anseongense]
MNKSRIPYMYSSFLLIFLVHDAQVGVGLPGFQRIVYRDAGHDAWLAVLAAGLVNQLIVWIMIRTLRKFGDKDLYDIHVMVYGKTIGYSMNLIYIGYFVFAMVIELRNYVEMIQVWLFPAAPQWVLSLLIGCAVFYGVRGGLRTIVGTSFVFICLTLWLNLLLYFPLRYSEWNRLLPLMEADAGQFAKGILSNFFTMTGFEILYFIYTYAKDKTKVQLYAQLGIVSVTIVYTSVMIVSIVFFSGGELLKTNWATFTMLKVIKFPFLERFEFIGVSLWLMVILPNLLFFCWAASRGVKRIFAWQQKYWLYPIIGVVTLACSFIDTRLQIEALNDFFAKWCVYLIYVYPFILYVAAWLYGRKHKTTLLAGETQS